MLFPRAVDKSYDNTSAWSACPARCSGTKKRTLVCDLKYSPGQFRKDLGDYQLKFLMLSLGLAYLTPNVCSLVLFEPVREYLLE